LNLGLRPIVRSDLELAVLHDLGGEEKLVAVGAVSDLLQDVVVNLIGGPVVSTVLLYAFVLLLIRHHH